MTTKSKDPTAIRCGYCDRPIRRNATSRTFQFADARRPVHSTCLHRLTVDPQACGCDVCTGDIH